MSEEPNNAMSDKLKAAEALAKAVRDFQACPATEAVHLRYAAMDKALAAYEVAPAESQAAGEELSASIPSGKTRAELDKGFEEFSRKLRSDYYEMTGRDYDTDFSIKHAPRDQSQQLAAAQARIVELEESTKNAEIECGLQMLDASDQRKRVAVLEKALEEAEQRWKKVQDLCVRQKVMLMDTGTEFQIWKHGEITAQPALAAQPSREKDV